MKKMILKLLSKFSLVIAAGEVSGASRAGIYQGEESEELLKLKKF